MSRTRTLVRGAFLSGSGVFVSMAAMLIAVKLFTNALDTASVGVFALFLVCADFLTLVAGMGLPIALPRLTAAAPENQRAGVIGSAILFQFLAGLLIAVPVLMPGILPGLARVFPEDGAWPRLLAWIWLLPPLFLIGSQRDLALAGLAGLNRYGRRAGGIVTAATVRVLLIFIFVWLLPGGLHALILTTIAAHGIALAGLYYALPAGARCRFQPGQWRQSVKFSLPLYANQMLSFFYQRFDTVLVSGLLGVTNAAIYEMAKRIPGLLSGVLTSMLVPFLPNISELLAQGEKEKARRLLNQALALVAFTGYSAALTIILLQEMLIRLLFTPEYLAATPVLGLLLAALCLTVQTGIMGQSIIALGYPAIITIVNVGMACLSVAANMLLLPRYGLAGGGLAALTAILFSFSLHAVFLIRFGLPLDLRRLAKPQCFMLIAGLILWWNPAIPYRLCALLLFVTLCLASSVIRIREIIALIRALLPEKKGG
jgi:O-antigen/teichoic acid export membrane protein